MQSKAMAFGKGKLLLVAAMVALVASLLPSLAFAADFTVTFDSAGGTDVKAQTVASGEMATKPTDPTRDNFVFNGWVKDGDYAATAWAFDTDTVTENITLVAKWKMKTEATQMWRLYNKYSGEHLFTNDEAEYKKLGEIGWTQEGKAWVSATDTQVPVYRLYNKYSGDHHYTTSLSEYNNLVKIGWTGEHVAFFSSEKPNKMPLTDDCQPVYRGFNPYETIGTHHYTLSQEEFNTMVKNGWRDEGVGWYVPTTA